MHEIVSYMSKIIDTVARENIPMLDIDNFYEYAYVRTYRISRYDNSYSYEYNWESNIWRKIIFLTEYYKKYHALDIFYIFAYYAHTVYFQISHKAIKIRSLITLIAPHYSLPR